ncbi:MAG: hypothetical protein L6R45_21955 [Anaerolineae bacterium]|nr:hypothetical protein [Anaerolineae bacterium]
MAGIIPNANVLKALDQIVQAINDREPPVININVSTGCCEETIINLGGGSVGVVIQPGTGQPIPIYGTQPPIVLPTGTIPDGYESQEEYDLDKCQMANLIIDDAIESVRRLGAITTFNTIALAGLIIASVVGVIIFPPAAIGVAVGALIVISGVTGALAGLLLGMQEKRQELVCALYEGDTVDSIIGTLADIFDEIIEAIPGVGLAGTALKTLALVLMNSETLNQLFKKQAHADYPNADCSGCGPNWRIYSSQEDYTSGENINDLVDMVIDSFADGVWPLEGENQPVYLVKFSFGGDSAPVINFNISGRTDHLYLTDFNMYSDLDHSFANRTYFSDTDPGNPYGYGGYYIVSSTPFTVTITSIE